MKVFVSYKRDQKESERLLSLLETKLSKPFATVFSDRLLSAGEWRPDLLKMIDRSPLFVVLVSEESVKSDEVGEEVRRAYDRWVATKRKKPIIIPVRVKYSGPLEEYRRDFRDLEQFR